MLLLNIGGGRLPIEGALTVDMRKDVNADIVCDLREKWQWEDESVDGIYMIHCLEHFPDTYFALNEVARVLKKGGFLHIQVPHSTSATSIGDLGHYRTFNHITLSDYLCYPHYIFSVAKFKQEYCKVVWWVMNRKDRKLVPFDASQLNDFRLLVKIFIVPIRPIIQWLIDLSPKAFERFWWVWVGGADELIWRGTKL